MEENRLQRNVGLLSATNIGLGAMLGAGIFVFPGLAGGYAGFGAIISFLIGGGIALLVAACTSELATAMPQSGGGYFFVSRAFGGLWGTLTGISQWVGLIFACSFYMVSFGEYTQTFLQELGIQWDRLPNVLSFIFTLLLLGINIIGTRKVGRFQNLMVISLTFLLVLVFTYGLVDYFGLEDKPVSFTEVAPEGVPSIFTASALIFTSYLGFLQIANVGGEVKDPVRNLPRSLITSVLVAMSLYIFVMTVCSLTFTPEELDGFGETATIEVARTFLGKWGAVTVVFAGVLAALSSANASMISASRGVFALSKDGVITHKASKINKRFGTPHIALALVTLPVAVMLFKSELETFAEVASFLHLIIYTGICLSVLKLRASHPAWYVPSFRVPAVKVVAGLGAVACLGLLFFMQGTSIVLSLGILGLACAYHFLYVQRNSKELSEPQPPHIDLELLNPGVLIPVDLVQQKKDLPHALLESLPISKLLLLGYRETPEQTPSDQSDQTFRKEGEEKLESIEKELEEAGVNFESDLIFSHKIASQLREVIEGDNLQFILTLKPLADLDQVVIPIHERSQIDEKLSTTIYNLQRNSSARIRVMLFTKDKEDPSTGENLRRALEHRLKQVNVKADQYDYMDLEKAPPEEAVLKNARKTDLIVWSKAKETENNTFLNLILNKEAGQISCPILMIL